ncbi:hypothetical protein ABOM_012264 [Aspergillus bombycis]|uniref:Uncharacterized protein n=1 Tax=Aspergillus bombycis TaxID=109264 RepID=A0A1F7ZJ10_9EURO|nr:hypothetical protein ABOM_012264 [Aspergillus bombycis]OGM39128.1 hypothetical protein ABOM_012264 [Aspergillus bombycis]
MSTPHHQGGTLSELAPGGTTIPHDAGKQNTIPSVPRPDQRSANRRFDNMGLGQPSSAFAADNDVTMPRGPRDPGLSGEVVTGTGNTLPAEGEAKWNQVGTDRPGVRGDTRSLKHGEVGVGGLDEE